MNTGVKRFPLAVAFLLFACTSRADSLLQEAETLLLQNRNHEAAETFLKVAERYPSDPQAETALFRAGEISFLELSEPKTAITRFEKIIREFPQGEHSVQAEKYIAEIYENSLRDFDRAVIWYQRLMGRDDTQKKDGYQFSIARCFYKKGDYMQAITEYRNLMKQFPESGLIPETEYQIANCYFVMDRCDEAIGRYQRLLDKYPNIEWRYDIMLSTGVCMEEKENYGKAIEIYRELMETSEDKKLLEEKIAAIKERINKRKNR